MFVRLCPVCHSNLNIGIQSWHWECACCGYENAELSPVINEACAHENINEQARQEGLKSLREKNFDILLQAILDNRNTPGKLLDVGCAHGWFLEMARDRGFSVLGIEPDVKVYDAILLEKGIVRQGFFPHVLSSDEKFDVIVFNDVFEHIPDVKAVLAACRRHLKEDGLLIINLPNSGGFFYKLSRILFKLGFCGFFERLWQKGLPSPHLHYFNPANLHKLVRDNGFEVIANGRLPVLCLRGLFARISYAGSDVLPIRLLIFFIIALVLPLLSFMPSDIIYSISRKNG